MFSLAKNPAQRYTTSQLLNHPFVKDADLNMSCLKPPWDITTAKDAKDMKSVCEILYQKMLKDASDDFIFTPVFKQSILNVVASLGVTLDEFLTCLEETIYSNSDSKTN